MRPTYGTVSLVRAGGFIELCRMEKKGSVVTPKVCDWRALRIDESRT